MCKENIECKLENQTFTNINSIIITTIIIIVIIVIIRRRRRRGGWKTS